MYLSIISSIFGILFILAGVAGFVPGFYINGFLFGIFDVSALHNVANFIVGFIALVSSLRWKSDRLFFQVFGILFGLLTIAGFVFNGNLLITHVNMADNILHLVIAIIFLILGFSARKEGQV